MMSEVCHDPVDRAVMDVTTGIGTVTEVTRVSSLAPPIAPVKRESMKGGANLSQCE